ncbi:PDZ domain-containing protein [candidate division WOR-3 bacterium]|nr:PDZ domain-containing protein [candidate division WOR-3 bacterium]
MSRHILLLVLALPLLAAVAAEEPPELPKRGWLGVYPGELDEALLVALDLDHGVLIRDVVEESPAARAGFLKGDIVLEFDGVRTDDPDDLRHAIRGRPEKTVKALVRRRGKDARLEVTLGERAAAGAADHREDHGLFELPRDALRHAARALDRVGPGVERVKVKVLEQAELHEELEELRAELESLKAQLEQQLEELRRDLKKSDR